jgi:hypothetical protein
MLDGSVLDAAQVAGGVLLFAAVSAEVRDGDRT